MCHSVYRKPQIFLALSEYPGLKVLVLCSTLDLVAALTKRKY